MATDVRKAQVKQDHLRNMAGRQHEPLFPGRSLAGLVALGVKVDLQEFPDLRFVINDKYFGLIHS
ncbi:hypothetical protein D9M69_600980 [compost metagenome]